MDTVGRITALHARVWSDVVEGRSEPWPLPNLYYRLRLGATAERHRWRDVQDPDPYELLILVTELRPDGTWIAESFGRWREPASVVPSNEKRVHARFASMDLHDLEYAFHAGGGSYAGGASYLGSSANSSFMEALKSKGSHIVLEPKTSRRAATLTRELLVGLLQGHEWNNAAVARRFGLNHSTVLGWQKVYQIKRPPNARKTWWKTKRDVFVRMLEQGFGIMDIAHYMGCYETQVVPALRRLGLEVPPRETEPGFGLFTTLWRRSPSSSWREYSTLRGDDAQALQAIAESLLGDGVRIITTDPEGS